MPGRQYISGTAVALSAAGFVFMAAGLKNATVADTIRALVRGEKIPSKPSDVEAARKAVAAGLVDPASQSGAGGPGGTELGSRVATMAESYVGVVPYLWAGEDPVNGWDCSGYVTWVLHHDAGIELPSNVHTVAVQFLVWSGARTIPRGQCSAGDLVCWATHIGIALDKDRMANAEKPGTITKISNIWSVPAPTIRRPLAYGLPGPIKGINP